MCIQSSVEERYHENVEVIDFPHLYNTILTVYKIVCQF